MNTLKCICENEIEVDFPDIIDLDKNPEYIDEILENKFFTVQCKNCSVLNKPEIRTKFISKIKNINLQFLPEIERFGFYGNTIDIPKDFDVLIGFFELYERAKIIKDKLDPEVIEIIKYLILSRMPEQETEVQINCYYNNKNTEVLNFHVYGLRKDEVAVLAIKVKTYEEALKNKSQSIKEPPFDKILAGQYKSIRYLEIDVD